MSIILVEHPTIDLSSFETQNRELGISGFMRIRNEGEFLAKVIESWIDYVDELVIVFHQCTDNTPEIIEIYQRKYFPKITAFHYLPNVYRFNTKEQVELASDNPHSFTFYSNFTLSKTRYKTCVMIDGDHVGIPEHLKKTYQFLKQSPLENSALFFSGVNLWKKPNDMGYYLNIKNPIAGDGDHAYWTVFPQNIFGKNPTYSSLEAIQFKGLKFYNLGFIFWHTHFLKKDKGLGNYGNFSEAVNRLNEERIENPELVPFSSELKQKNQDLLNISVSRFPLYFNFGSLPEVKGVDLNVETFQLAVQHHRVNRLDLAEQMYCQVLERQPDHPEVLYRLGVLAQQIGRLHQAEEFLCAALRLQPNSVQNWFSWGNLRQTQGQLLAAEEAYRRAIALSPNSAPIYNNLGYVLQQQGKLDEAIACYQEALKLQPNCAEAKINLQKSGVKS